MKYDCELIRDLLPLCQDGVASANSQKAVDAHLLECAACRSFKEKMKTAHSQQPTSEIKNAETLNYLKVARRVKRRRTIMTACISLIIVLILYAAYSYAVGGRFDAYQCAQNSYWVDEQSILLGDVESGSFHVYLYENEDKYRTIGTKYSFPFWMPGNSSWANKTNDSVKLVGWYSQKDGDSGITVVPVQCFDENVAYIEMGDGENRLRKEVKIGDVIIFSWPDGIRWNDLNGLAYSNDGEPLYRLGYDVTDSVIVVDELRWLPINSESGE